jgi:hypothetical protein
MSDKMAVTLAVMTSSLFGRTIPNQATFRPTVALLVDFSF